MDVRAQARPAMMQWSGRRHRLSLTSPDEGEWGLCGVSRMSEEIANPYQAPAETAEETVPVSTGASMMWFAVSSLGCAGLANALLTQGWQLSPNDTLLRVVLFSPIYCTIAVASYGTVRHSMLRQQRLQRSAPLALVFAGGLVTGYVALAHYLLELGSNLHWGWAAGAVLGLLPVCFLVGGLETMFPRGAVNDGVTAEPRGVSIFWYSRGLLCVRLCRRRLDEPEWDQQRRPNDADGSDQRGFAGGVRHDWLRGTHPLHPPQVSRHESLPCDRRRSFHRARPFPCDRVRHVGNASRHAPRGSHFGNHSAGGRSRSWGSLDPHHMT